MIFMLASFGRLPAVTRRWHTIMMHETGGQATITAEEILNMATNWKSLKSEEIDKVRAMIAAQDQD